MLFDGYNLLKKKFASAVSTYVSDISLAGYYQQSCWKILVANVPMKFICDVLQYCLMEVRNVEY